eukprot:m.382559 g.382559  ORF g.382559 m.382559 type:complete len:370 (+) comp20973_c0_seq1:1108-2217(+)
MHSSGICRSCNERLSSASNVWTTSDYDYCAATSDTSVTCGKPASAGVASTTGSTTSGNSDSGAPATSSVDNTGSGATCTVAGSIAGAGTETSAATAVSALTRGRCHTNPSLSSFSTRSGVMEDDSPASIFFLSARCFDTQLESCLYSARPLGTLQSPCCLWYSVSSAKRCSNDARFLSDQTKPIASSSAMRSSVIEDLCPSDFFLYSVRCLFTHFASCLFSGHAFGTLHCEFFSLYSLSSPSRDCHAVCPLPVHSRPSSSSRAIRSSVIHAFFPVIFFFRCFRWSATHCASCFPSPQPFGTAHVLYFSLYCANSENLISHACSKGAQTNPSASSWLIISWLMEDFWFWRNRFRSARWTTIHFARFLLRA